MEEQAGTFDFSCTFVCSGSQRGRGNSEAQVITKLLDFCSLVRPGSITICSPSRPVERSAMGMHAGDLRLARICSHLRCPIAVCDVQCSNRLVVLVCLVYFAFCIFTFLEGNLQYLKY